MVSAIMADRLTEHTTAQNRAVWKNRRASLSDSYLLLSFEPGGAERAAQVCGSAPGGTDTARVEGRTTPWRSMWKRRFPLPVTIDVEAPLPPASTAGMSRQRDCGSAVRLRSLLRATPLCPSMWSASRTIFLRVV